MANDCRSDCKGAWGGAQKLDTCKVCGGDNTTCATTQTTSDVSFAGTKDDYKVGGAKMNALLARQKPPSLVRFLPDFQYLFEPFAGVWLLGSGVSTSREA